MMHLSRKFTGLCIVVLLLVNIAVPSYAATGTEFREIMSSDVNPETDTFFGVSDYLAAVGKDGKVIFYSLDAYEPVKVFEGEKYETAWYQNYVSDNGAYNGCFAAIVDGKYVIYDSSFHQITPNQYYEVSFYGKIAVGLYNYGSMLSVGYDLIDLSNGQVLEHLLDEVYDGHSRRVNIVKDQEGRTFFQTCRSIWNSDGERIFATDAADIIEVASQGLEKGVFLWKGEKDGNTAIYLGQDKIDGDCTLDDAIRLDPELPKSGLATYRKLFYEGNSSRYEYVLMNLQGNEIARGTAKFHLLSYSIAMSEDDEGRHYYNSQGSTAVFDQYARVSSLYYGESPYLTVQSAENGKWGVVDSSGNIIIPVQYDAIEGLNDENGGVCSFKNGESYEIWNIAAKKQLFVSSDNNWFRADESDNLKYVPSGWIAHTSGHAGNTEAVRNLYDASGRLLHENIRKTFNINNKIYYAKAISLKSGQYQEALVDEYNRVVFTAPVGRYIQKASSNVIITSWWNAGTTTQQIFIRTASDSSKNTGTKSALLQIIPFDTTSVLTASRLVSLLSQHGIVQVVH